jgi:hypothetical protein
VRVLDPGHRYVLAHLDGDGETVLQFVKRQGPGYPGNEGRSEGVTLQEVLRALIDRATYVNGQIPCDETTSALAHMKSAVHAMETRAARLHGRPPPDAEESVYGEYCRRCGHVGCDGSSCRAHG